LSKLTFADIERFLAEPREEELYRYLEAAAVLAAFNPAELRPVGQEAVNTPDALLERLLTHCDAIVQGRHRGLYSLKLTDRRAALKRLGTRERMRDALKANTNRPSSPLQKMLEHVLENAAVYPQRLVRDELVALIDVGRFVRGILDGVPDEELLTAELARQDLLAPLHRLVEGFVNRRDELSQLERYIAGPPQEAPLFIFGVGGVGKSTLIARFLLDHVRRGGAYAYLDIDRPTIRPDAPETLVLEIISQLGAQLQLPDWAVGATSRLAELARRRDETRSFEALGTGPGALDVLHDLLQDWAVPRRLALVIDTFEEAQFLGTDVVAPISYFLTNLAQVHPSVRVVVSGRTFPPEFAHAAFPTMFGSHRDVADEETLSHLEVPLPVRPMNLGVLGLHSARRLLDEAVEETGMPQLAANDRDAIIDIVSRNPMCLKLAARLLRNEGVEKLREARSEVLALLKAEKVQALLYGRILTHLHAEDVRRIAYPGLIVRRVTPEVVREVLAGPCGLQLSPERSEHHLYWELAREAALVEHDPYDGSLRHRTDVRRAMLGDLTDYVNPELVVKIDRAAVAFYESQDDPVGRAEELYHRMRLREPDSQLDTRWMPEAAPWLKNVGDEVAPQQRLWLASKLGATLDPAVRREASQQAWEEEARLSAARYLAAGFPDDALAVLQERAERLPRSPLYTLEADAYRLLGRKHDALRVARAGVESASAAGAIDLALELVLAMVVIEEGDGHYEDGARLSDEAAAITTHSANGLLTLRTLVTRLRLDRRLHPKSHGRHRDLREAALHMLTPETLRELRRSPVLLREVAAELGESHGPLTATAIETLGIEADSDEQARALGLALTTAMEGERAARSPVVRDAVKAFEDSDFNPDTVRKHARRVSGQDTREISSAIVGAEPGAQALQDFGKYFRVGVDSALRAKVGGHQRGEARGIGPPGH
jgi:cellulose synthase operon protein C